MDAICVFRGRNEGRHGIHVRGENDSRMRLLRQRGEDIGASTFNDSFTRLISHPAQLMVQEIPHRAFIAGNRFDVDQLPRKREHVFILHRVLHRAEQRHDVQNSVRRAVRENIAA